MSSCSVEVKATAIERYDAYKDSGVEWLGEIPEHWDVVPGLRVLNESKDRNIGFVEKQVLSLSYGNVIVKPEEKLTGLVPESFETYQLVRPGDIIIRPTDLQNDQVSLRTGLARDKGIITSAYINLRPLDDYDNRFAHYYLHTIDLNKVLYGLGSGLRQNISFLDFRRMPFPRPSSREQTAIANFLDDKMAKIDRAIAIKQKQIELLKERRQILIHNAVTRGLDPNVEMKDSGVEWIGEVPKHWEVKRLKFLADCFPSNVDKHSRVNEKEVRLCNYTDVYKNAYITDDLILMVATASSEQIEKFRLRKGDIVITKDSETASDIAVPAFVKEELSNVICGYHLAMIRTYDSDYNRYLYWAMLTKVFNAQFEICSNGITRVGLGNSDLKGGWFLVPKKSEQNEIANHLESISVKVDSAISVKQNEIEKLKEYKASLVNSVVTGKIKL